KLLFHLFTFLPFFLFSQVKEPINVPSGKFILAGEIWRPEKLNPLEKIPAIIFVVGSKESSYRTNYKSFSKFFFEDLIEEQKIALAHFDKRGIGNSTGKWYKTTLEER